MNWDQIRAQRNQLLKDSDWTQLRDGMALVDVLLWADYRQELRDLTSKYASPEEVVFPQVPPKL